MFGQPAPTGRQMQHHLPAAATQDGDVLAREGDVGPAGQWCGRGSGSGVLVPEVCVAPAFTASRS